MPAESTFDIVSEFDRQEMVNAVDQTQRDVRTRFDLKDSKTDLALGEKELCPGQATLEKFNASLR